MGGKTAVPIGTRTFGGEVLLGRQGETCGMCSFDMADLGRTRRVLFVRGELYAAGIDSMAYCSGCRRSVSLFLLEDLCLTSQHLRAHTSTRSSGQRHRRPTRHHHLSSMSTWGRHYYRAIRYRYLALQQVAYQSLRLFPAPARRILRRKHFQTRHESCLSPHPPTRRYCRVRAVRYGLYVAGI